MAAYQGATRRNGLLGGGREGLLGRAPEGLLGGRRNDVVPAAIARAPALRRRRARSAVRAGRRTNRVGLALGGIVLAFMLAFFSLAQSVRVSATGYDIASLQAESDRLLATRQDLLTDINRLGSGPAIRKQALDRGLSPLAAPLIVPAR
jgi:cell division protein FtsB